MNYSGVSINDFEQINAGWDTSFKRGGVNSVTLPQILLIKEILAQASFEKKRTLNDLISLIGWMTNVL